MSVVFLRHQTNKNAAGKLASTNLNVDEASIVGNTLTILFKYITGLAELMEGDYWQISVRNHETHHPTAIMRLEKIAITAKQLS